MPIDVVVLVTNTPTPYRNHMYSLMKDEFALVGIDFIVWFTSRREPLRKWGEMKLDYPHEFLCGKNGRTGIFETVKVIPRFLLNIYKRKPDLVIAGGYYDAPNLVIAILNRFGMIRALLWHETHQESRNKWWLNKIRVQVLRSYRYFIIPGLAQKLFLENMLEKHLINFIYLPNIIDENLFLAESGKIGRFDSDKCVFFCALRLIDSKGISEIIAASVDLPSTIEIRIAGDGPLRQQLLESTAVMNGRIKYLGHISQARIIEELTRCDVFLLPSRNDPYPLSVIEALWLKKPLILSNGVGCHFEALQDEGNGWVFEKEDSYALHEKIIKAASLSSSCLESYGSKSLERAQRYFVSRKVVQSFVAELRSLI